LRSAVFLEPSASVPESCTNLSAEGQSFRFHDDISETHENRRIFLFEAVIAQRRCWLVDLWAEVPGSELAEILLPAQRASAGGVVLESRTVPIAKLFVGEDDDMAAV
jgi:hypothetical protein